ncbi:MAG: AAA family ATPase [bacterium]
MSTKGLTVELPPGGYDRAAAVSAVRESGLPSVVGKLSRGPFGTSSKAMATLEAVATAVDVGLAASGALKGLILEEATPPDSFAVPALQKPQQRLVSAFQLVVTADAVSRRLAELGTEPDVEGTLELDGFEELLDTGAEPEALASRVLRLAGRYLELHPPKTDPNKPEKKPSPDETASHAASTLMAFLELVRRTTLSISQSGALRPLTETLKGRKLKVAGYAYEGLQVQQALEAAAGLLPMLPDDIVGNADYLEAGMRLARDVAGFDLRQKKNPKRLNPVLFGLGRPGCGKTVTAHAIGNYFLDYCRDRQIPAKFQVIRRTDWASSYQNASAMNLVRIFREEVYGFEGVCGVYWADIDTALASRSNSGLRMEEKQNLGAVFGIFDGTLLPKDGKWFLVCDANTMHMDEAAISRIAQNPFTVEGPTTVAHYVRLMRDLQLKDQAGFIPRDEEAWARLGQAAVARNLSGRAIDAVCGNIRSRIQNFEYPDSYFKATVEERQELLRQLSNPVTEEEIYQAMVDWHEFQREAEERAQREKFEADVASLVHQLNASRAAAERAVSAEEAAVLAKD